MAQIDARIPLQAAQPLPVIDPVEQYAKVLSAKNMLNAGALQQEQLANARLARQQAEREIAEGQAFRQKIAAGAPEAELYATSPKEAAAYLKNRLDARKAQIEAYKAEWDALEPKRKLIGNAATELSLIPAEQRKTAYAAIRPRLIAAGLSEADLPEDQPLDDASLTGIRLIANDPKAFIDLKNAIAGAERKAAEEARKAALHPSQLTAAQQEAIIKHQTATGTQPIQPVQAAEIKARETAAQALERYRSDSLAVQLRGQNLTDSRQRDLNQITRDTKPPTEAERRNAGFYTRAMQAAQNLDALEDKVKSMDLFEQGRLKYFPNILQPEDNQIYTSSSRQFTEARLRRDSGAAIPPHEYENDRLMYFPQPGDTKTTLDKKRQARMKVLTGLKVGAGRAAAEIDAADAAVEQALQGTGATQPASTPTAAPARPRATNPQTGEVVEFDGTKWVKVGK